MNEKRRIIQALMSCHHTEVGFILAIPATMSPSTTGYERREQTVASLSLKYRSDMLAVGCLILAALVFSLVVVRPVHEFVRGDWPTQFFPVYSYLGERLRAFDIPGWNPHQFSGAPFLGDPESGWMYFPAMLFYTLLPAEAATITYIGFHIALAGIAIYAFGRVLGLSVMGSLIAGASYALAWVAPGSMHLVIFFPAAIWMVIALIGVTLAVRASSWAGRLWSWLLASVAISQVLAIWLGQASYYVLLMIGSWIVYETIIAPQHAVPLTDRAKNFLTTSMGIFGLGFCLSAASVLPRLDAVSRSNLAGGVYDVASAWEASQIGFSFPEAVFEVVGGYSGSLWWYSGAVAGVLALIAPVVALRWKPMPFFALAAAVSLTLSTTGPTPLHNLLYALLPRFEILHEHSPERILILFGPAVALLAGATVSYLPNWPYSRAWLIVVAAMPAVLAVTLGRDTLGTVNLLSTESTIIILATTVLVAVFVAIPASRIRQLALLGVLILVLWDPSGRIALRGFLGDSPLERTLQESLGEDPSSFLYDNAPATFLQERMRLTPGRYAGFDPALLHDPATIETVLPEMGYRSTGSMNEPRVNTLLVFNWGTWFGIEDIQGYNPIQVKRYVEYMDAMNGHRQEYHERDLYQDGLRSPLLDLLNLRYLIVPEDATRRTDIAPLLTDWPLIYEDARVRIYENELAFDRAWIVHEARQIERGEALSLLNDGTVDPAQVALLETTPPALAPLSNSDSESATYISSQPDQIEVRVEAETPALLVMSEVWDPGWSATIENQPSPTYVANHTLLAVPVPAGEHTVILRYDPPYLKIGLALTITATICSIAAAIWLSSNAARVRAASSQKWPHQRIKDQPLV